MNRRKVLDALSSVLTATLPVALIAYVTYHMKNRTGSAAMQQLPFVIVVLCLLAVILVLLRIERTLDQNLAKNRSLIEFERERRHQFGKSFKEYPFEYNTHTNELSISCPDFVPQDAARDGGICVCTPEELTGIFQADHRKLIDILKNPERKSSKVYFEFKHITGEESYEWYCLKGVVVGGPDSGRVVGVFCNIDKEKRENELLLEKANTDPLTGLYNRNIFTKRIQDFLGYRKNTDSAALFYIDIDFFKQINDTLGHSAGDEVLKDVSNELKNLFRKRDTVSRISGDEFAVFLPGIGDTRTVEEKAETIRKRLQRTVQKDGKERTVTASIGATFIKADDNSYFEIIDRADKAMYTAKIKGRNKFVVHSDEKQADDSYEAFPEWGIY